MVSVRAIDGVSSFTATDFGTLRRFGGALPLSSSSGHAARRAKAAEEPEEIYVAG